MCQQKSAAHQFDRAAWLFAKWQIKKRDVDERVSIGNFSDFLREAGYESVEEMMV